MDSVSQRRIAASAFVLICAVKVPLLLSSDIQYFSIGCLLDAIFFLVLYRASIPWMRMSKCGTVLLILGSWILNMGILGSQTVLDHDVLKSNAKEKLRGSQGHIIGSHQVNVRPPTIAKLNPNASFHCAAGTKIPNLPLLIKGNPPWIIQVDHLSHGQNTQFNLSVDAQNLTLSDAAKAGSKVYWINVNRLGKFQISAIYEGKTGDRGKVIPSTAEITSCPEVKWKTAEAKADVCLQKSIDIDVILKGTPPLSLWILKSSDSSKVDFLTVGSKEEGAGTFSTAVKYDINKQSDFRLSILRVTDGNENTVDYDTDKRSQDSLPKLSSKATNIILGHLPKFEIFVHSLPKVQFAGCQKPPKIKMDNSGQNTLEKLRLSLKVSGSGQHKIEYRLDQSEEESESIEYVAEDAFIEVLKPGTYVLTSIEDNYCKGTILEPSSCDVIPTFPPTISVFSTPIESACIGAIGLTANLSFTGDPPFWVDIQQELIESGTKTVERYKNLKARHLMRFQPSEGNGTYRYTFLEIGDAIYTEGVKLKIDPISQIVHSFPSASIQYKSQQMKCVNDSAKVTVAFEGAGPWSLSYEIMHDQYKKQYSLSDIADQIIVIDTPIFSKSGLHVFSLTEVADANGCRSLIDSQDLSIEIFPHRPSVSFYRDPVHFLEHSVAELPLNVSGRGDIEITYVSADSPLQEFKISGSQEKMRSIQVDFPGEYQLTSIHDSFCRGIIKEPRHIKADLIPKPKLILGRKEGLSSASCVGRQEVLSITLKGKPPFTIFYIHNFTGINGHQSSIAEKEQTINNPAIEKSADGSAIFKGQLILETSYPGIHTYHFLSISDSNYDSPLRLEKSYSIEQQVDSSPTAEFMDNDDKTFYCLSEKPGDVALPIKITGRSPFILKLQKRYDFDKIETFSLEIKKDDLILKNGTRVFNFEPEGIYLIGSYTFEIVSLKDSTLCEVDYQNNSAVLDIATSISINIADQAKIVSNNPKTVCIGDMLTYALQGTAPFTIGYSWNGVEMKELLVTDPILTLFASEPGIVSIDMVCNAMKCCTKMHGSSVVEVKNLPSAIVDGGEDLIEDIREGEESVMLVEFKGTPPFSISWSRSEADDDRQMESFSASNIETFKYSISTQQEGIFIVTSVSDQFCGFPRSFQDSSLANAILGSPDA